MCFVQRLLSLHFVLTINSCDYDRFLALRLTVCVVAAYNEIDAEAAFDAFDVDGDGVLSFEDLKEV